MLLSAQNTSQPRALLAPAVMRWFDDHCRETAKSLQEEGIRIQEGVGGVDSPAIGGQYTASAAVGGSAALPTDTLSSSFQHVLSQQVRRRSTLVAAVVVTAAAAAAAAERRGRM